MKVLVTGGGCEEPIDTVRSVCNFSTGRTSAKLAQIFADKGCQVTALIAKRAVKPEPGDKVTVKEYISFKDLEELLFAEIEQGNYDAVIHAAAVADYSPQEIEADGVIYKPGDAPKFSGVENLVIKMKKNPKLADSIKLKARKNLKLVAFKLTSQADADQRLKAVLKVMESSKADFVVSNDLSEITTLRHPCRIYSADRTFKDVETVEELGQYLLEVL